MPSGAAPWALRRGYGALRWGELAGPCQSVADEPVVHSVGEIPPHLGFGAGPGGRFALVGQPVLVQDPAAIRLRPEVGYLPRYLGPGRIELQDAVDHHRLVAPQ